jgi:hypothetical protein
VHLSALASYAQPTRICGVKVIPAIVVLVGLASAGGADSCTAQPKSLINLSVVFGNKVAHRLFSFPGASGTGEKTMNPGR